MNLEKRVEEQEIIERIKTVRTTAVFDIEYNNANSSGEQRGLCIS